MNEARTKRFSPSGWKYVNKDGTVWPQDEWIRYSAKHPRPTTASFQVAKDPSCIEEKAHPYWSHHPDPCAARIQVATDQWDSLESGGRRYLAIITLVRPLAEKAPTPEVGQTKMTDYMQYKTV